MAQGHKSAIVTSDLGFGGFFYWSRFGSFEVIILRSRSQNIAALSSLLRTVHQDGVLKDPKITDSLIIVEGKGYRWRRFKL